eukprot:2707322-Amphidinium_carterae.6
MRWVVGIKISHWTRCSSTGARGSSTGVTVNILALGPASRFLGLPFAFGLGLLGARPLLDDLLPRPLPLPPFP